MAEPILPTVGCDDSCEPDVRPPTITCSAHYEHGGWEDDGMSAFFINNGWHSTLSSEETLLRAKRIFLGRVGAVCKVLIAHADRAHDPSVIYKLYAPDLQSAEEAIEKLKRVADVSEDCIKASVVPVDTQGSQVYPGWVVPPRPPFVVGHANPEPGKFPPFGGEIGFARGSYRPMADGQMSRLIAESRFGNHLKEARQHAAQEQLAGGLPKTTYKICAPTAQLATKAVARLKAAGVSDRCIEAKVVPVENDGDE